MKIKMNNNENKLAKNFILYFLGNFGSNICLMLIVPLYTYYVKPDELGVYDLTTTAVPLLIPIVILSIHEGLYRWLLTNNKDEVQSINIISYSLKTAMSGLIISGICIYTIMYFINYEYRNFFILLLVVQSLYIVLREASRGLQHIGLYVVSGIMYTVVFLINIVLFLCLFKLGLQGLFTAIIISYLTVDIFVLLREKIIIQSVFTKSTNIKSCKGMLKYSSSLILNSVSWWVTNYSDRYMIKIFINTYANGIYSIAAKYPSALTMLTSVFYSAWAEEAILYYNKEGRDDYYTKVFNNYALILLSFAIFLQPFSKLFIILTMDTSYHLAVNYVGFLYLGSVFQAFSVFYGAGYLGAKQTKSVMWTTAFAASLNIIINMIFMKNFGLQIAGISTFAAYFAIWLIRAFDSKKYFEIKVHWFVILILTTVNIIIAFALKYMSIHVCIVISALSGIIALAFNLKNLLLLVKGFKKSND